MQIHVCVCACMYGWPKESICSKSMCLERVYTIQVGICKSTDLIEICSFSTCETPLRCSPLKINVESEMFMKGLFPEIKATCRALSLGD